MNAFSEIDAQIARLHDEIRQLSMRRNTLTGLCKLPVEILLHIASLLQVDWHARYDMFEEDYTRYDGKWTRLMLTCRLVRAALLDARSLWALVNCGAKRGEWADLCAQRSGGMAGTLTLCVGFNTPEEAVRQVTALEQSWDRAYAIKLGIDHNTTSALGDSHLLERPSPALRSLYAHGSTRQHDYQRFALTDRFLGGGQCHGLRDLSLSGIASIEQAPLFPNLTRLYLETEWIKTPHAMGSLLDFFERVPLLQKMTLVRSASSCFANNQNNPVDLSGLVRRAAIPLPHLHALCIADFRGHVHLLLRVLPEPARTLGIKIVSHKDRDPWQLPPGPSGDDVTDIFTNITAFWTNRTGQSQLPAATIFAHTSSGTRSPAGELNSLWIESDVLGQARLYFSTRIQVHTRNAIVDQATALHIERENTGPFANGRDLSGAAYMVNLHRLVVYRPQTLKYMQEVEKWMKARAKTHGPIQELVIKSWADKLDGKMQSLKDRFQSSGMVTLVTANK